MQQIDNTCSFRSSALRFRALFVDCYTALVKSANVQQAQASAMAQAQALVTANGSNAHMLTGRWMDSRRLTQHSQNHKIEREKAEKKRMRLVYEEK